jgi:hypothetical protein
LPLASCLAHSRANPLKMARFFCGFADFVIAFINPKHKACENHRFPINLDVSKGRQLVSAEQIQQQWVYAFSEGDGSNKQLLGGKGANLCEMTQIGLNVPPGFVITTQACLHYLD